MKQNKSGAVILFLASFYAFLLLPLTPLWAQAVDPPSESDTVPPVIQHKRPRSMGTEQSLPLEATVSDNVAVKEVRLFYRTTGKKLYTSIQMKSGKNKNTYQATIPKEAMAVPGLDYYFKAIDNAGNTASRGFSHTPIFIMVSPLISPREEKEPLFERSELFPPVEARNTFSTGPAMKKPWYKKWWVWAVAVAVVGGGAAAAGGGGGGNGSSSAAGAPPTGPPIGAATVSGPIP